MELELGAAIRRGFMVVDSQCLVDPGTLLKTWENIFHPFNAIQEPQIAIVFRLPLVMCIMFSSVPDANPREMGSYGSSLH